MDLSAYGIVGPDVVRNAAPASLYEAAIRLEEGSLIADCGALVAMSGDKTGRTPREKRIVVEPTTEQDVDWGEVNIPLSRASFEKNRDIARQHLSGCRRVYVVDGFAGWDPAHQLKIRIVCERAYHALFMHNMLIRPTREELETFGDPDFVIYNAGCTSADPQVEGVTSNVSVALALDGGEAVILGTEYAGEMKKGVFTVMNYLMPRKGVLSMHCSANASDQGDVSLFFGLSGTGKTTLSADPQRSLIGDDEHCWTPTGVFNIEGGCYAKVVDLTEAQEPEIYRALRFGSVLENVVLDERTRAVDYTDRSITENTRGSYPIEFIPNAAIPCVGGHPTNIILLTCDAFGVLPPVSRLTPEQAMYHFISGYTAKIAGTEEGITEPVATFSACFGAAFLVWHPTKYAEMLAEMLRQHQAQAWLVNTGWSGGAYGEGARIKLRYTRGIIDAIHNGELVKAPTVEDPVFGLHIPTTCTSVPDELLVPRSTWSSGEAYDAKAQSLALKFHRNFQQYDAKASDAIRNAGPRYRA